MMKKVVILLLLFAGMRDYTEAASGFVPSPLASGGNDSQTDVRFLGSGDKAANGGSDASVAADPNGSAETDVKEQWTASLLTSNPFVPFNLPKEPEKKSTDDDWASKKADELNLYSVTRYPDYTEVSIEVIATKKRCWLRSDQVNNKVPFVFAGYDEESKVLSVKNTVSGEIMKIRQQKKKETARSSDSPYGDGYYGSSSDYDDFFFGDF